MGPPYFLQVDLLMSESNHDLPKGFMGRVVDIIDQSLSDRYVRLLIPVVGHALRFNV